MTAWFDSAGDFGLRPLGLQAMQWAPGHFSRWIISHLVKESLRVHGGVISFIQLDIVMQESAELKSTINYSKPI